MYDKDEDRKKRRRVDMLVRELKEELEARDQPKTGNKAWLRRWLHGRDIVRAHLAHRATHRLEQWSMGTTTSTGPRTK